MSNLVDDFFLVKTVKILFYYSATILLAAAFCFSFLESASQIIDGNDFATAKINTVELWYMNDTEEPVTSSITECLHINYCFQNSYKVSRSDNYNRQISYSLYAHNVYKQLNVSYCVNSSLRSNAGFYYLSLRKILI